ncbi:hypothetical protein [Conexibacter woesei]|uniref:Uncharacterized protein n=1 Tax=Conexibacter woesei (strain DSM 14684 / CCUG 47730 / CIP 108061 / JCM 11494 / NBRC 100937 / ID131577) TaxID=469383 RepID=D3F510_CONWI|nr:hypothetical protein [Conexibacter woesei]ADB48588.1 hypothetical protein Cwoe_0152 [Conexibacter woesei DSM 14684]
MSDTLLAAIVGAVATLAAVGFAQLLNHAREARRARKASDEAWGRIEIELGNVRESLDGIRVDDAWPIGWNAGWWSVWEKHSDALRCESDEERERFRTVQRAFGTIDQLQHGVNTRRPDDGRGFTARDREFLDRVRAAIEAASGAVAGTARR